ncbi:MAG TPA: PQQ-binding-like beta-propeller repeat protein [Burkholderiales bacterium]|nr:PQQ-binding-like beta-propeller repeat protein [Burkholderiales bacterium]
MKPILMVSALIAAGLLAMSPAGLTHDDDDDDDGGGHHGKGPSAAALKECCTPGDKDYPTHSGNLGNQGYSGLTQINKGNIKRLGPVWRTHVSAEAPATDHTGQQTTPIVVDGVIYLDTPNGSVIAVDGATGATKWKWTPAAFGTNGTRRGVSVGDGKVYTLADDNRVVALNKDTGLEVWVVQPRGPGDTSLGNIDKVATVYHDGMVYVGTNDGNRNAAFALKSSDGSMVWSFYGGADVGTVVTDVNGNTVDAGATWGPPMPDGRSCAVIGGVSPWIHGALDPELGMAYYAFGNVRSCGSSQDGSTRPGVNLFANSVVAVDLKTGAYKWHHQSIRHDVWDMDNVHALLLADVRINSRTRKAIYHGSKSGHLFVLDRTNGKPLLRVDEVPMTMDSRQKNWPTQPFPTRFLPHCLNWQALEPKNVPGDPWRAVPNYNGYQPNASGQLVYTEPNYLDPDKPFLTIPPEYGATHRKGCMYDTHWDLPVLSTTSQNGGPDWSSYSFSHKRGLIFVPYGVNPVAHWRGAGGNGQRALGQYQTGGILALDAATNKVRWTNHTGLDMGHGQGPLSTASDLVFVGMFDGNFLALDAVTGKELWRFQTGAAISAGAITYAIGGDQYVAIFSAGTGIPYGNSITEGDSLWAFKLGGKYKTASGSSEDPTPAPLTIRRPVGGNAVEGTTVNNTVYLGRSARTDAANSRDSVAAGGMNPTHLRVPVGTTVTFLNPGVATFPNFPNQKLHCATQFFEGLFNPKLNPGESFQYTFTRAGEYFFNDCTDPRPTGKVVVYLTPQDAPNALHFLWGTLDLGSSSGLFTDVHGVVTALFKIPAGYTLDGEVKLKTPLSTTLFDPVSTNAILHDRLLLAHFRKSDIDNNIPEGDSVPLVLTVNVIHEGEQKQLTSTATVRVVK